jgi:uncharacterized repeat protein (TIGR03943 family)
VSWDAASAISFLVGLVTLRLATTPQMQFYVKTGMKPLLIVAAVVLIVLGLGSVLLRARGPGSGEESASPDHSGEGADPGEDHGHRGGPGARIGWMVLTPLVALMLVAPAPLGAFLAARAPVRPPAPPPEYTTNSAEQIPFPPLHPAVAGAHVLSLGEFTVRALYDPGRSLEDATVRLTGFVTPRKGGGFYLTRFAISCCAADARPVRITVLSDGPAPPTETWLVLEGTWIPTPLFDPVGDDPAPDVALQVETSRRIPAPDQPYEY